jgi:exonuclease SbcC
MRIERLTLHGFLRFAGTVTIDLRDVPPGLIAIVGENGAGKTTLLEAPLAALHRTFPTRGGLKDYAVTRESYIDCEFSVDGRGAFRARVNVDGVSGGSHAVLEQTTPDGTRLRLNDGKLTTYDAVVQDLFPSRDLLLASCFSAQNKVGNFIGMKPAEGKKLFTQMLGLAHLERLSQVAKLVAFAVERTRDRLVTLRDELARQTDDRLVAELERIGGELHQAGDDAAARRRDLATEIEALDARLAVVADQAAAYAAATQRIRAVETETASRKADEAGNRAAFGAQAKSHADDLARITAECERQVATANQSITKNEAVQSRAAQIRAAVLALTDIDGRLADARLDVTRRAATERRATVEAEAARATVEAIVADEKDLARCEADAALLGSVPCGGGGAFASCQFLKNATAAQGRIGALTASVAAAEPARSALTHATLDLRVASDACESATAQVQALERDRGTHVELAKYADVLAAAEARIEELTAKKVEAQELATRLAGEAVSRHVRRVAELDAQAQALLRRLDALDVDLRTARADLAATTEGAEQAIAIGVELKATRAAWDAVTATLARVEAGQADLARRRRDLAAAVDRHTVAIGKIAMLATELVEWQFLTKALGRDGLPVLEIDAAGPTITAIVNQLLEACFGPRFTVELLTQAAKADGKGLREDFSLQVFDNARGGDARAVADLSGGEQVIVSEAVMNAISIYVNQRSAMPIRTCWRDETTGALDPENAQRYLAMLRTVHALGGFHHTLFISHNPDIAGQADAQIRVANGTAVLVSPPFAAAAA